MNPREFVIGKDATLRSCVYTVIPVINHRLLDLPFHLRRLYESNAIFNKDAKHLGQRDFNDMIADSCLRKLGPTAPADGLLTICVGSDNSGDPNYISEYGQSSFGADALLYEVKENFFFTARDDVIIDLQEDPRSRDCTIKASCWPLERVHIESRRPRGVTETLLFKYDQSDGSFYSEQVDDRAQDLSGGRSVRRKLLSEGEINLLRNLILSS